MKKSILPYRQLMTPQWIKDNAVIAGRYNLDPQYYEISATTGPYYQLALQIPLVSAGILKPNDSVSVTIILAMDTAWADGRDHDFRCGISDNTSFVGFIQVDEDNYKKYSPCRHLEAEKGNGVLVNSKDVNGHKVSSNHFSGEIKMQFKPTEQWGSCHTEHQEGYTNIANYDRSLDLTEGLFLEMYRQEPNEIYRIKYISAYVELE